MPAIQLTSVSKSYRQPLISRSLWKILFLGYKRKKKVIFENLTLSVRCGSKVLIVGPNGSGKTTLLKIMGGFSPVDLGRVLLDGKRVSSFDRKQIGVMLSNHLLYTSLSGFANLEYSCHLFGCRQESILRASTLWDLHSFIDRAVGSYSNGMKSLLALARATLHGPQLLLLDEPTAFLDAQGIGRLRQFIKTEANTLVITTQQPEQLIDLVDDVIRLETH